MKDAVIIVAAGSGSRFGSTIPKQFLSLLEKPVYIHTISRFLSFNPNIQIILVIPQNSTIKDIEQIEKDIYIHTDRAIDIVLGGESRFDSVKKGLSMLSDSIENVAIHDAVRPLVAIKVIENCFKGAEKFGNAIPVIALVNSLRKLTGDTNQSVDRDAYKMVQTPQCFQKKQIIDAYMQCFAIDFTDDASVVEAAGYKIKMVEGNQENIKITTPPDFLYAELLLKRGY